MWLWAVGWALAGEADDARLAADNEALRARLAALELEIGVLGGSLEGLRTTLEAGEGSTADRLAAAQAEIDRLVALNREIAAHAVPPEPPAPPPADESTTLLHDATEAAAALHFDVARAKLDELVKRYPGSTAANGAARLAGELAVIGTRPGEPNVLQWYTAPGRLADAPLTLVVFFEIWCPHCKEDLPHLSRWIEDYGDQGLQVVALTRLTRNSTEDQVRSFVADHGLTWPIGREDGKYYDRFSVTGIPAAALVRDGEVVWRGHPERLTPEVVEALLPAPDAGER